MKHTALWKWLFFLFYSKQKVEQLFVCPPMHNSSSLQALQPALLGVPWGSQSGSAAWAADENTHRPERPSPRGSCTAIPCGHKALSTRTSTQNNCNMGTLISLWLKNITDDHILKTFLRVWLYWLWWWKERLEVELHMGGQINNWLKTW